MKRWKKVLIWVVSILVLLGVGGLFAANYAADKMIASLAASLEAELNVVEDTPGTEQAETPSGSDTPTSSEGTEKDPADKSNIGNEASKPSSTGEKDLEYARRRSWLQYSLNS